MSILLVYWVIYNRNSSQIKTNHNFYEVECTKIAWQHLLCFFAAWQCWCCCCCCVNLKMSGADSQWHFENFICCVFVFVALTQPSHPNANSHPPQSRPKCQFDFGFCSWCYFVCLLVCWYLFQFTRKQRLLKRKPTNSFSA